MLSGIPKPDLILDREHEESRLLEAACDLFADCTNCENTVNRIARLLVSSLATWCTIDLVGDNGKVERVAGAHAKPSKAYLVKEMLMKYPPSPAAKRGVYKVIDTGQPILISHVSESSWAQRAESAEHLRLIMELGSSSYMCIPLFARNQVIGSFMMLSDDRTYDERDLNTAMSVAKRLAVVIDTAKQFEHLQKSIKARDEFLAIAAHEIRNPLSLIAWQLEPLSEILSRDSIHEADLNKIRSSLGSFQRQMERLNPLFNKLLDRSKIDDDHLKLEISSVHLLDLVKNLISRFQAQLASRGIKAILKENQTAQLAVGQWDQDRLEQVVSNLISNAIKYGDGRDIQLEVTTESDQANLFVHDQGIGIPERDRKNLFEPFQRLKMDSTVHGTGLGMYISKRIIEAHGGQVSAQSVWGQGSTFRIRLPLNPTVC